MTTPFEATARALTAARMQAFWYDEENPFVTVRSNDLEVLLNLLQEGVAVRGKRYRRAWRDRAREAGATPRPRKLEAKI